MRRVLVVRFSSLGDVLQTRPAVNLLQANGYEVHFLTKRQFAPLVSQLFGNVVLHSVPNHATLSELNDTLRNAKKFKFDYVVDLHRNIRSMISLILLQRPSFRIRKYRTMEVLLFLLRRRYYLALGLKRLDKVEESLRIVTKLIQKNGQPSSPRLPNADKTLSLAPTILLPSHIESELSSYLESFPNGFVCISTESAWTQKQWPIDRFAEVASRLISKDIGVVWLGAKPLPQIAQIQKSLNLHEKVSLAEASNIIKLSKLLICNDSGLMHLSEANNIPVVAIFGPTSRELGFPPRLNKSQVVESQLWCRPCSKTGRLCFRPISKRLCLFLVSADSVFSKAIENLTEGKNTAT